MSPLRRDVRRLRVRHGLLKAVGLRDTGPCLSPFNAFMLLTGVETLPLRMERHAANALAVAEYLVDHPLVEWCPIRGASSPYLACQGATCPKGPARCSPSGSRAATRWAVVESCELFSHLANIGDTRSLIIHPASTTHRQLDEEQAKKAGAGPEVIRLSIGLADIIADLEQALRAAARDYGERCMKRLQRSTPVRFATKGRRCYLYLPWS